MPTRAIKFKLIVPRDDRPESLKARRALWATHEFVNQAVAYYEHLLLEMRQEDVCVGQDEEGKDVIQKADDWSRALRIRLEQKKLSGKTIEEALPLFRGLYAQMVQSHEEGESGSAQDSRNFHSYLVSGETKAGESDGKLIEVFAPLLKEHTKPNEEWKKQAEQIIKDRPELLKRTGRNPKWVTQYRASDRNWLSSLHKDLGEKIAGGSREVIKRLQELEALPICNPFGGDQLAQKTHGALTKFERMAFAHTVGFLNSWESWGHRARQQYDSRKQSVDDWHARYDLSHEDALKHIRAWEHARQKELERVGAGLGGEKTEYRLTIRELRGWDRLRAWLQGHPKATREERLEFCAGLQTKLKGRFGGAEALRWLASQEQQWLADHPAGDVVSNIALLNAREALLARTRRLPTCTLADAVQHPRYAEFDPPNNSNQPPYSLECRDGVLRLKIQLLCPSENGAGLLKQEDFSFPLAPSGQAVGATVSKGSKKKQLLLVRRSQDGLEELQSPIGGSALIFDRRHLENTDPLALRSGLVGSVYVKVAVDNGEHYQDILRERGTWRTWFNTSAGERVRGESTKRAPGQPVRILSVDLGLRHAACVSVWNVEPALEKNAKAPNPHPSCRHERSAVLGLPGENPSKKELARRRELDERLADIRRRLGGLANLRRLCLAKKDERGELLETLAFQDPKSPLRLVISEADARSIEAEVKSPDDRWKEITFGIYRASERRLGEDIGQWRKSTRGKKSLAAIGGKSAWTVEHLTRALQTLLRWHRHQPPWCQEVMRFDRTRFGSVSRRLREHINRLKDDRAKSTADLIVQAARGVTRLDGKWHKRFEPVDIIVMEDLTRYRSRTDRPPAENRQLMRWIHREVRKLVEMQAEEYGIATADTSAICSSKFDAESMAPGYRCQVATREDVAALKCKAPFWLRDALEQSGVDPAQVVVGDVLPTGSGEWLACVRDGRLKLKNADVNAAQNIGRWYIDSHRVPFRVSANALEANGRQLFVNANLGKRAQAAFGGAVIVLEPSGSSEELFRVTAYKNPKAAAKALGIALDKEPALGGRDEQGENSDDADLEMEGFAEELAENLRERVTFFCDPSGGIFNRAWVKAPVFWNQVRVRVVKALRESGKLHG